MADQDIRNEVVLLRNRLNGLAGERSKIQDDRSRLNEEIPLLIQKLKDLKRKDDRESTEIQGLRTERDRLNGEVKALSSEVKALNKEYAHLRSKLGLKEDPLKIKERIVELRNSIETEGYTCEQERRVQGQIQRLKRRYAELSAITEVTEMRERLVKEIKTKREKATDLHKRLKGSAQEKSYDEFILLSKKVTGLRAQRSELNRDMRKVNKEFFAVNNKLKERLITMNRMLNIDQDRKRRAAEITLIKKMKMVEEKFRQGKKLTTEDIIVFQNGNSS